MEQRKYNKTIMVIGRKTLGLRSFVANFSQAFVRPIWWRYVQRDFVRIYLIFIAIALTACASTNEAEYASFRVGSDHFDSFQSTFERSLCADGREKIIISLSLNKSEKAELVRLAKLDIAEGNSGSGDLEKICVSSFPYEITVGVQGKTSTTTCFSPIGDDESRVAKFVYSLESVQKLPKSQCRFY